MQASAHYDPTFADLISAKSARRGGIRKMKLTWNYHGAALGVAKKEKEKAQMGDNTNQDVEDNAQNLERAENLGMVHL